MSTDPTRPLLLVVLIASFRLAVEPDAARAQMPDFTGLSTVRSQYFENENLLFYVPAANDNFGAAFATGDFNGDGADDLAAGVPGHDGLAGFPTSNMGIVVIRYGVPGKGLATGLASTVLAKDTGSAPWTVRPDDRFGSALAAGDFNGDGYDDLAVGAPGDAVACTPGFCGTNIGAVYVFYGWHTGLGTIATHQLAAHSFVPFYGWGEQNSFGSVLAAGNFNGDLYDDLAIASPLYDFNNLGPGYADAGGVWLIHGTSGGINNPINGGFISLGQAPLPDQPEAFEHFGQALAVGNFNGDSHTVSSELVGFDDLAIGVPSEDDVGAVLVLYGSVNSLLFGSHAYLGDIDVGNTPEVASRFGATLLAADLDGNGADDLAIGSPHRDVGTGGAQWDGGRVTVLYGQVLAGFDLALTERFSLASIYGPVANQAFDYFGSGMAAVHYNPYWSPVGEPLGTMSLIVGAPGWDLFGADQGGFTVLRGTTAGVFPSFRTATLGPETGAVPESEQIHQFFGLVFASGDFDADGYDDLAGGHPYRRIGILGSAGSVMILYGAQFADGFESNDPFQWSAVQW